MQSLVIRTRPKIQRIIKDKVVGIIISVIQNISNLELIDRNSALSFEIQNLSTKIES